jgi:hypothetical protein
LDHQRVKDQAEQLLKAHYNPAYFEETLCFAEFMTSSLSSSKEYKSLKVQKSEWMEAEKTVDLAAITEEATMAIQNLAVFRSILNFLSRIEKWHLDNQQALEKVDAEVAEVEASRSETFGLFRRTSRADKVATLSSQKGALEVSIRSGEELLQIGYALITLREISEIRQAVHERNARLINNFREAKCRLVEAQLRFWSTVREAVKQEDTLN